MPGRIVVVRPGALGDTILTLPALSALRAAYPQHRLTYVGNPSALEIIAPDLADDNASIDDPSLSELFDDRSSPSVELGHRFGGAELVVLWLKESEAVTANFRKMGARAIVSAPSKPPDGGNMHAVDYLLGTLAGAISGCAVPSRSVPERRGGDRRWPPSVPRIDLDPSHVAFGRAYLDRNSSTNPTVAIHPGSGAHWKCWPVQRFAAVGNVLAQRGFSILLVAGPADCKVTEHCTAGMTAAKPVIAEGLSVSQLAGVLNCCAGFVGNDSGVSHLAAALGIPTVAVYGATDPQVWGVRGSRVMLVSGPTLDAVTPQTVLRAIDLVMVARSES